MTPTDLTGSRTTNACPMSLYTPAAVISCIMMSSARRRIARRSLVISPNTLTLKSEDDSMIQWKKCPVNRGGEKGRGGKGGCRIECRMRMDSSREGFHT